MWRVAKLHRGVCECVCVYRFIFRSVCVCAFYNISKHYSDPSHHPNTPLLLSPSTHHSSLPLHCHLSTREAFPEHTANKVGQVRGWALFLSESNFQEVPTGKRASVPQTMEPWQGVSPPPLTSAELLTNAPVQQELPCPYIYIKTSPPKKSEVCLNSWRYTTADLSICPLVLPQYVWSDICRVLDMMREWQKVGNKKCCTVTRWIKVLQRWSRLRE